MHYANMEEWNRTRQSIWIPHKGELPKSLLPVLKFTGRFGIKRQMRPRVLMFWGCSHWGWGHVWILQNPSASPIPASNPRASFPSIATFETLALHVWQAPRPWRRDSQRHSVLSQKRPGSRAPKRSVCLSVCLSGLTGILMLRERERDRI